MVWLAWGPVGDGAKEVLSERQMLGIIRKQGAVVDRRLREEGWVDEEEIEALGWVEWTEATPAPGEVVFVPMRDKWVKVRWR